MGDPAVLTAGYLQFAGTLHDVDVAGEDEEDGMERSLSAIVSARRDRRGERNGEKREVGAQDARRDDGSMAGCSGLEVDRGH